MDKKEINKRFKALAKKRNQRDSLDVEIKAMEDELKAYMTEAELNELIGDEHKATWKEVISNRIDTKLLKAEMPKVAERYTKASTSMRFTFA